VSGVVSALSEFRSDVAGQRMRALGATLPAFGGEWTKAMSEPQIDRKAKVKSIVFPVSVTALGEWALCELEFLESVVFPAGCTIFGRHAFADCRSLKSFATGPRQAMPYEEEMLCDGVDAESLRTAGPIVVEFIQIR
jgi:hypothetical protein